MKKVIFYSVLSLIILALYGFGGGKGKISKTNTNDDYNYLDINAISYWFSNNGDAGNDPRTGGNGLYWPLYDFNRAFLYPPSAVYEEGIIWGGFIGDSVRVGGSTYRHGLQAGKILDNGVPDDPNDPKYKIYKIRSKTDKILVEDRFHNFTEDYENWPVEDGAPWEDVNGDGVYQKGIDKPKILGDETMWYVANDLDSARNFYLYGSAPVGIEVQQTLWGYETTNFLADVLFKKLVLINKSKDTLKDTYIGLWCDGDMGDANDDYVGCDTLLNLGYFYNGSDYDDQYNSPPPAIGYVLLQGPIVKGKPNDSAKFKGRRIKGYKNIPMTAFYPNQKYTLWGDTPLGRSPMLTYNTLQGKLQTGEDMIDPITGLPTRIGVPGDPVTGEGWSQENWSNGPRPGDKRFTLSAGPFDFAPQDTQEVIYAFVGAFGSDRLNSVTKLKEKTKKIIDVYLHPERLQTIKSPQLNAYSTENGISLWWTNEPENYRVKDFELPDSLGEEVYHKFEGYRIWQYADEFGNDPKLVRIIDLPNNIYRIENYEVINSRVYKTFLFESPDNKFGHSLLITKDYFTDLPPEPEKTYYFGITAYSYCPLSSAPFHESIPQIVTIQNQKKGIDYNSKIDVGDLINAKHINGVGDGKIDAKIFDPLAIGDESYKLTFDSLNGALVYQLLNSYGDTLIKNGNDFIQLTRNEWGDYVPDSPYVNVVNGFALYVSDIAKDAIVPGPTKYKVKDVVEVIDSDITPSVWNKPSSEENWMIVAKGPHNRFNWQERLKDAIGFHDYEIRFTDSSQYYLSGYTFGFPTTIPLHNDFLAEDKLPFQIWDIGQTPNDTSDDKRLAIKVLDHTSWDSSLSVPDSQWTRLPSGDWEEIYAFEPRGWNADDPAYPPMSGTTLYPDHKFGGFVIRGELPKPGTIIRITTWKILTDEDEYLLRFNIPNTNDKELAKTKLNEISVFPNPFFDNTKLYNTDKKITFVNLPDEVKIRIYSLSGHLVKQIYKNNDSSNIEWDLKNRDGLQVASGIYIAHLDMPGIGEKIIKIAVVF